MKAFSLTNLWSIGVEMNWLLIMWKKHTQLSSLLNEVKFWPPLGMNFFRKNKLNIVKDEEQSDMDEEVMTLTHILL